MRDGVLKNNFSRVVSLKQRLVKIQNRLVCLLLVIRFQVPLKGERLIRLGSSYGGWWVPEVSGIGNSEKHFVVSAGLGGDVTFDKEMLTRGFTCIGLDPLQEAIAYSVRELSEFPAFIPINSGLSDVRGTKVFFAPQISNHDSWSINNMHRTDSSLSKSFDVLRIEDLEQMYPCFKNASYRILKMDIEGGEIPVLRQIVDSKIKFDYLAVELDFLSLVPFLSLTTRIKHFVTVWKLMAMMEKLGYSLCSTENFNFCWKFISRELLGEKEAC